MSAKTCIVVRRYAIGRWRKEACHKAYMISMLMTAHYYAGGCVPPFYVFATGNAYHAPCCAAEVTDLSSAPTRKRVHALLSRLSRLRPGSTRAPQYGGQPEEAVAVLQVGYMRLAVHIHAHTCMAKRDWIW